MEVAGLLLMLLPWLVNAVAGMMDGSLHVTRQNKGDVFHPEGKIISIIINTTYANISIPALSRFLRSRASHIHVNCCCQKLVKLSKAF
jgi:hypothetical protein